MTSSSCTPYAKPVIRLSCMNQGFLSAQSKARCGGFAGSGCASCFGASVGTGSTSSLLAGLKLFTRYSSFCNLVSSDCAFKSSSGSPAS